MKLEPVYLLAPEPDLRVKLSRRAFTATLLGSCLASAVAGGSLTYAWLSKDAPGETEVPPADPHLTWALEVARGTDEDIAEAGHAFLRVLRLHPDHELLRRGGVRLAEHLVRYPGHRDHMSLAAGLLAIHRSRADGLLSGTLSEELNRVMGR